MLDRTIPFYNTLLRCDAFSAPAPVLPEGFSFSSYRDGFENDWARMECAVGDFDTAGEALDYFRATYLADAEKCGRRSVFLLCGDTVIGSCFAWEDLRKGTPVSSLHWLILDEAYQGRGLGRALTVETMRRFPSYPVYIHTQPWSWKAILLYISLGFRLQKTDTFSHYENQYDSAVATLASVLTEEQMKTVLASVQP